MPGHLSPHIYFHFPSETQLKGIIEGLLKDKHNSTRTKRTGKEMLAQNFKRQKAHDQVLTDFSDMRKLKLGRWGKTEKHSEF